MPRTLPSKELISLKGMDVVINPANLWNAISKHVDIEDVSCLIAFGSAVRSPRKEVEIVGRIFKRARQVARYANDLDICVVLSKPPQKTIPVAVEDLNVRTECRGYNGVWYERSTREGFLHLFFFAEDELRDRLDTQDSEAVSIQKEGVVLFGEPPFSMFSFRDLMD